MSVPYGQAYTTPYDGTTYCTIMASIPCLKLPYFSNPEIELEGWGKLGDENQYNNAKWIKENRFVLADRGNESLKCENVLKTRKKVISYGNITLIYVQTCLGQIFFCYILCQITIPVEP